MADAPSGAPRPSEQSVDVVAERPRVPSGVARLAFWAGVVLPFLYVPYVVTGPETPVEWGVAALLLAGHALALLLGHSHSPGEGES